MRDDVGIVPYNDKNVYKIDYAFWKNCVIMNKIGSYSHLLGDTASKEIIYGTV